MSFVIAMTYPLPFFLVTLLPPPRVAGTVDVRLPRPAVAATRHATVAPSASTRTGGTTCTTVPLGFKVYVMYMSLLDLTL